MRAFQLLTGLSARHDIELVTFTSPGESVDVTPLRQLCGSVRTVVLPRRALGWQGALDPTVPRHFRNIDSPDARVHIGKVAERVDVVLALQATAAFHVPMTSAPIARVLDEVEIGLAHQDWAEASTPAAIVRRAPRWWKARRFTRALTAAFDRVTVVSSRERQLLGAIGCDMDRIVIVPNGVDLRPRQRTHATAATQMIYPGPVAYEANLDAVRFFGTAILPHIRLARPDWELVVTGQTGSVDTTALSFGGGVRFTGPLADIHQAVAGSRVCVVPLRRGGGTRLKVLQAMALGVPVVSTSKGVEGLDVAPGLNVLVADDPAEFARYAVQAAEDEALRARLTTAARRLVEDHYSWDVVVRGLDRILHDAVERRQALHPR